MGNKVLQQSLATHKKKTRRSSKKKPNIFQRFFDLPPVEIYGRNIMIMSFNFATCWAAITAFTCWHIICN